MVRAGVSERRRVLVVSHTGVVWGAQRRLLDLAPLLAEQGFDLAVAAPPDGDLLDVWRSTGREAIALELPEHHGIRITDGSRRRPPPTEFAREAYVVTRWGAQVARLARRYDLVQSHSLWAHLEVALAGRLAQRPVVLDLHDLVDGSVGRRVLRAAVRLASATIANSAATAATAGGVGGTVHVVHPGVDLGRFHPGPCDPKVRSELTAFPDQPLIGIYGRVDPRKGVDILVEAMALLSGPASQACLAVVGREFVGDRTFISRLHARAAELLGDRARFLPPRDDLPDVLRATDVLVNASLHEPFGRTVLEAQAIGVSVIGTAAGGIPEFVEPDVTGLLVPPRDARALADAIERLLGDAALQDRLRAAGIRQARESFSVEAQSRAVARVYQSLVGVSRS